MFGYNEKHSLYIIACNENGVIHQYTLPSKGGVKLPSNTKWIDVKENNEIIQSYYIADQMDITIVNKNEAVFILDDNSLCRVFYRKSEKGIRIINIDNNLAQSVPNIQTLNYLANNINYRYRRIREERSKMRQLLY